jgi:hypothetical protein
VSATERREHVEVLAFTAPSGAGVQEPTWAEADRVHVGPLAGPHNLDNPLPHSLHGPVATRCRPQARPRGEKA